MSRSGQLQRIGIYFLIVHKSGNSKVQDMVHYGGPEVSPYSLWDVVIDLLSCFQMSRHVQHFLVESVSICSSPPALEVEFGKHSGPTIDHQNMGPSTCSGGDCPWLHRSKQC